MKNSVRHGIASQYSADLIGKSKDNEVVDVSCSMINYLAKLPEYVAPSIESRRVVFVIKEPLNKVGGKQASRVSLPRTAGDRRG